jgi:penicillin-binding protein 1A
MKFVGYLFLAMVSLGIIGAMIGVGGVVWAIHHYGQDIPDYKTLKTYEPDVVTRVYTGDGQLMAEFATEKRVFIPIENIPERVKQAFISAEDNSFYEHSGIDYLGIVKAVIDKARNPNSQLRGASTITQQVAKNFLLTNERTYERKIKEAILAIRMERAMEKDRLLELYLNEIYLGVGTYGVAAAAQHYFNKPLDDLTIEEAAYLAALPKAPNNYHPIRRKERATARRDWVIERMAIDGFITQAEANEARETELSVDINSDRNAVRAPYFAEEIRRTLQKEFGNSNLYEEGMLVKSSINPAMQEIATRALQDGLMAYDLRHGYRGPVATLEAMDNWQERLANIPVQQGMLDHWRLAVLKDGQNLGFADGSTGTLSEGGIKWGGDQIERGSVLMVEKDEEIYRLRQVPKVQGAIIVLDPHTGRVLAIQGGWDYERSEFNRATQAQRQPGSAFKPFIYLTALEEGMTPATIVMDAPVSFEQGPGLPRWRPKNYSNDFYGPTTLRVGIEKSRNVMTVRLSDAIGMDKIAATAKDFGIHKAMKTNLASSLGSTETTLMQMVAAYGMLVNGGKAIEPSFIDRIQNRYGETIYKRVGQECPNCGPKIKWEDGLNVPEKDDNRTQVTDPKRAYQMVSILEGGVQRGTGVRLKNIGFPVAGKTGTTNDAKDTWFIGFTPDLVFGAYVGFDQPKPLGRNETGSSVALPIIKQFLEDAFAQDLIEPLPFRVPSGISLIQVNAKTGRRAYSGETNTIWEAFLNGESPAMQRVVYGGNSMLDGGLGEEPDFNSFFQNIPQVNQGLSNGQPSQNSRNNTSRDSSSDDFILQGTGGIY